MESVAQLDRNTSSIATAVGVSYIIYKHTNKINGKVYIGQTHQKPKRRWQNGGGYDEKQPYFRNAIKKYGWDNFKHEILVRDIPTLELANYLEQFYVSYYHTWIDDPLCWGYNMTKGGDGIGFMSESTKKKIGKANSVSLLGKHCSPRTEFTSERVKELWKDENYRKKQCGRISPKRKIVLQYDLDMNFIREYSSATEAEKITGIKHITCVCRFERNKAGGYIWRFKKNGQLS